MSHPKPSCGFWANYISQRELYTTATSLLQPILCLTFQNSSTRHFILKDMNIYLVQMTAEQSDNNSHRSEHETLQLRYSRENPTNLRVQAREDWRKRYRMVATNQTLMHIDRKKTTLLIDQKQHKSIELTRSKRRWNEYVVSQCPVCEHSDWHRVMVITI